MQREKECREKGRKNAECSERGRRRKGERKRENVFAFYHATTCVHMPLVSVTKCICWLGFFVAIHAIWNL